jgi:hypothetical protein
MQSRARQSEDLVNAPRARGGRERSSCAHFYSTSKSAVSSYPFQASPPARPSQTVSGPSSCSGNDLMYPMNLDIARSAARSIFAGSVSQMRREVSPAPVVATATRYAFSLRAAEGCEARCDATRRKKPASSFLESVTAMPYCVLSAVLSFVHHAHGNARRDLIENTVQCAQICLIVLFEISW